METELLVVVLLLRGARGEGNLRSLLAISCESFVTIREGELPELSRFLVDTQKYRERV